MVRLSGISRTTLLYYERIGLLQADARTNANYRLYSPESLQKLEQISVYRQAGLSLEAIAGILDTLEGSAVEILEQRLQNLNEEISRLRRQQQLILDLLGNKSLIRFSKIMNKDQWVRILRQSGLDDDGMRQWHREFEKDLPEAHTDFLESLGIPEDEIQDIKSWSKHKAPKPKIPEKNVSNKFAKQ